MRFTISVHTNKDHCLKDSEWGICILPAPRSKIDLNTGIVQEPDEGCVDVYEVEVTDGNVYICL